MRFHYLRDIYYTVCGLKASAVCYVRNPDDVTCARCFRLMAKES